jgi:PDZ domain
VINSEALIPKENSRTIYDQKGNVGIGHMSGGTIEAGAQVTGVFNKGDTTTSAEQRARNALTVIKDELQGNFLNLSITVKAIEDYPPSPFWDIRRANETELAYQDRAKAYFQDYLNTISLHLKELKFSTAVYDSYQRDLSHHAELVLRVKKTYEQLDEVRDSFARLESGLNHLLKLNLNDIQRVAESTSLHREKIANAKLCFAYAAAQFCLVLTEEIDTQILSESLASSGLNLKLQPGTEGWREAMNRAAKFAQEKTRILEERIKVVGEANQREVERRIQDPYLKMLREATGLPLMLSEGEVFALQNKEIDRNERDLEQLFKLAAFSFLESDGHASTIYFERALECDTLSPILQKFARLSVDRLQHPDTYEGSLGIMVMKIMPNGSFERSGLEEGDAIITLDGKAINEPGEIASALGKSGENPIILGVIRDGKLLKKVIQGGESAGVVLSQLVVLNPIQL